MKTILKRLALILLPEPLLSIMKSFHYFRILRSVSDDFEPEFAIIKQLVYPGDYVVDIGANIGVYTKYLS